MALESFVSGPYACTYKSPGGAAVAVGLTDQGFTVNFTPQQEVINSSDIYGGALLDAVTRGHNATLAFDLLSYRKSLTSGIIWQFTSNPAILWVAASPAGRLYSDLAGEIVLTGQANTPAAVVDNNSGAGYANNIFGINRIMTASLAVLAPGQNVQFLMDSRLRKLPLQFSLLPYTIDAGTTVRFFVPS